MLRSLDPNNDFQPKSKKFIPTKDEEKKFSKNELASIRRMQDNDDQLRVQRELKRRQEDAIRVDLGIERKAG